MVWLRIMSSDSL